MTKIKFLKHSTPICFIAEVNGKERQYRKQDMVKLFEDAPCELDQVGGKFSVFHQLEEGEYLVRYRNATVLIDVTPMVTSAYITFKHPEDKWNNDVVLEQLYNKKADDEYMMDTIESRHPSKWLEEFVDYIDMLCEYSC